MKSLDPRWEKVLEEIARKKEETRLRKEQEQIDKQKEKELRKVRAREAELARFEELEKHKEVNPGLYDDVEEPKNNVVEEFYCPVCDKVFKSKGQLVNHEKSKAHIKKMKEILAEVAMDDELYLVEECDEKLDQLKAPQTQNNKKKKKKKKKGGNIGYPDDITFDSKPSPKIEEVEPISQEVHDTEEEEDLDFAMLVKNKKKKKPIIPSPESSEAEENTPQEDAKDNEEGDGDGDEEEAEGEEGNHKRRARREERKKKKEKRREEAKDSGLKCKFCEEAFPSKTQIFQHLKNVHQMGAGKKVKRKR